MAPHRIARLRRAAWIAAYLAVTVAGCSDHGLTLARVSGKVTVNGKPVENGTVFFMPDEDRGTSGPGALGAILTDGSYVMSTDSAGDGVIVGTHKVGITGVESKPVDDTEAIDIESSPDEFLRAKAKSAARARRAPAKQDAPLLTDRGGRKFRYLTPIKLANPAESGISVEITGTRTVNFDISDDGSVKITP